MPAVGLDKREKEDFMRLSREDRDDTFNEMTFLPLDCDADWTDELDWVD